MKSCDHCGAEHYDDSDQPIDAAWLLAGGWVDPAATDRDVEAGHFFDLRGTAGAVLALERDDAGPWTAYLGSWDEGAVWPGEVRTRGDVRLLLKAMGVLS